MKITSQSLPKHRSVYKVEFDAQEVELYFSEALVALAKNVNIAGFRPGKVPVNIARDKIGEDALKEEAYTRAVRVGWNAVLEEITKLKDPNKLPIEDPAVDIVKFEQGGLGEVTYSFDSAPIVKVKNWEKIKLPKIESEVNANDEVERTLEMLREAHATTKATIEPIKDGSKVEISFSGTVDGKSNPKLNGKKMPFVMGRKTLLPDFEKNLIGMKRGESKKFSITFPADYHDKEMQKKKAEFSVTIDDVFELTLPKLDDEMAKKFGHDKLDELKAAIKQDVEQRSNEELASRQDAAFLSEMEKCVEVELPESIVRTEMSRTEQSWRQFLHERSMSEADWFNRHSTDLETMRSDWKKAAQTTVKVGLGVAEIAKQQKKELKSNEDFREFVKELIAKVSSSQK